MKLNFQDIYYNLTLSYENSNMTKILEVSSIGQMSSLDAFNETLYDNGDKKFIYNLPPIESINFSERKEVFHLFQCIAHTV